MTTCRKGSFVDFSERLRLNPRLWVIAILFLGAVALCNTAQASDDHSGSTVLVLSDSKASYREAANALVQDLKEKGISYVRMEYPHSPDKKSIQELARNLQAQIKKAPPQVIVTAGSKSSRLVIQATKTIPIVFLMVPNALDRIYQENADQIQNRVAGVPADISPKDQVHWIQAVSPKCNQLAVLCSQRTKKTTEALKAAAARANINVIPIEAEKNDFAKAIDTLNTNHVDGVMMIPDAEVYNGASIKRLILWGIRQKKPVWTFSPSIVKPGALAGLYADPEDIGRQGATVVHEILDGKTPEAIGIVYPDQPLRVVNTYTADKIGIPLDRSRIGDDVIRLAPGE